MKQIVINSEEMQTRVAVVYDGVLHDFFMERKDSDRLVGSIFKGRIKNLEPSLQAAFVDIGCGKNAFLHYWDMLPASQEMLEGEEENELPEEEPLPRKPVAPAPVKVPEGNGFFARLCRLFKRAPEEPVPEAAPQPKVPVRQNNQRRRKKGNAPK